LVVGSVEVLERVVDVEVVGGGWWWESGGEESAYEVVAGCREAESNQAEEGPSGVPSADA
jgi:hypothetical protein